MAQIDPPKEASMFEWTDGRLHHLSSNKMTHYFKEWTTASGVSKKDILSLQKFEASGLQLYFTEFDRLGTSHWRECNKEKMLYSAFLPQGDKTPRGMCAVTKSLRSGGHSNVMLRL